MPLVTDATQTREIYQETRERGAALLNLNPEAPRGIEACLRAAKAVGERVGAPDIPIILSVCGTYHLRPQIEYYTSLHDPAFGFDAWWSLVNFYCDPDGPFGKIRAITHLDHGQPGDDDDILEHGVSRLGSVMFDASTMSLEENIAATASYVERFRDETVVEGCVDEIFDSGTGEQKNQVTTVEQAKRYVDETGVDLIVPNLGTEHRASARDIHYHGDQAQAICAAVGKILVLHGTSSLSPEDYTQLKDDGIMKVNLWTAIEKAGAQGAVRNAIENLGNIFTEEELRQYIAAGMLGEGCVAPSYRDEKCFGSLFPKLDQFAECVRRDAWVEDAQALAEQCIEGLGYAAFGQ